MRDKLAYEHPIVSIQTLYVEDMVRTSGETGLSFNFHELWGDVSGTFNEGDES